MSTRSFTLRFIYFSYFEEPQVILERVNSRWDDMKKPDFIGLDTQYKTASGKLCRRIHMDGAASPLAAATALKTIEKVLPHYSNTHSYVHSCAQISTKALAWANQTTLNFVSADIDNYTAVYTGSGSTAAINRVARGLSDLRPDRKIVLVSAMEHHANDLPHRANNNEVIYIPLAGEGAQQGSIDLEAFEALLIKYRDQINYVAVSLVSNVTGIINPVSQMAQLTHQHKALIVVDAAQAVAHLPIALSQPDITTEIDFFIFSGHKLYTPGSPGLLIAKKTLLEQMTGQDLGGGSVSDVSYYDYQLHSQFPDREQSGTPNFVGAIALAAVMQELNKYGRDKIYQHNNELMTSLLASLAEQDDISIYGSPDSERIGAVAFNHQRIDHGLFAAILNDYYAIAVRNECFCAHPYVSSMLKESLWALDLDDIPNEQQQTFINRKRGMIRVSLSLYNNQSDIDCLINAIQEISNNINKLREHYHPLDDGSYKHKDYQLNWQEHLKLLC